MDLTWRPLRTWREEGIKSVRRGGMARPSWGGVGRVGDYWSHSSIG